MSEQFGFLAEISIYIPFEIDYNPSKVDGEVNNVSCLISMKNGKAKKIARPKKNTSSASSLQNPNVEKSSLEAAHNLIPDPQNEKSSFLQDISPDAVVATDRELNFTRWDKAAEAMFGWQAREALGKQGLIQVRTNVLGFLLDGLVMNSLLENTSWFGNITIFRKDGFPLTTTVTTGILWDEHGEFDGLVATFHVTNLYADPKSIQSENQVESRVGKKSSPNIETLHRAIKEIVQAMAYIAGVRDPYTAGHQRRVAQLSFDIARFMGLHNIRGEGLTIAAFVHDIGKIHIPEDILSKPGKLTKPEYDMLKEHTRIGYDILKNIEFPWPVAKIVLQHHERMNGSGYPSGISGDQIMVEARILAVADVVEAMSSDRPYRRALSLEEAFAEINTNKGILYDPQVVDVCMKVFHNKGFSLN